MTQAVEIAHGGASGGRRPLDMPALAVIGTVVGLYGWLMFLMSFHHDGIIGPRYGAPATDYMVFWEAVRGARAGDLTLLSDPVAMTAQINAQFQDITDGPLPLHPWLYPPTFLLALLPFATLPLHASYALFMIATWLLVVIAGWRWAGPPGRRAMWFVALALAPGASNNVLSGQNAFLTLALLFGGIGLLGRRDIAAGALLGLLSFKPQLAVLAPVALVATGNWRALAAAAASALLAAAASMAVFGFAPWQDWIGRMIVNGAPGDSAWVEWGRLWGTSVWTCAKLLGAPGWLANAAQGAAALLAAGAVWRAFRRPLDPALRLAVLLTAIVFAAPHCSPYDLLLLNASVLLLLGYVLDGGKLAVRPMLWLLPWYAPLTAVPRAFVLGYAVPLLMLGVIVVALFPLGPRQHDAVSVV
jgi:hypothetical protein